VQRDVLVLALEPRLREGRGEEGGAVEDEAVQVVALAEGDERDVGMAALEQAARVEVVGQGDGLGGRCGS
jgi:hypothetical protein